MYLVTWRARETVNRTVVELAIETLMVRASDQPVISSASNTGACEYFTQKIESIVIANHSASLNIGSIQQMNELLNSIESCQTVTSVIEGHTDKTCSPGHNRSL